VGKKTGPNPTDRAKRGTKRSLLTDGAGVPLAVAVAGANVPDMRLVEATIKAFGIERPSKRGQHLCADKGYDYTTVRTVLIEAGYTLHIPSRGETRAERPIHPHGRARRWVVERTHSWMNRFRRLLVRWEKREQNYEAMLHLACAWITMKLAGVFG